MNFSALQEEAINGALRTDGATSNIAHALTSIGCRFYKSERQDNLLL